MTTLVRTMVRSAAAVILIGTAATAPVVAAGDPPSGGDRMTQMMTTIDEMHRLMQDMQAEMQHMPGMRPMQGRMGRAMGMAQQMRGMMGEHRSQMQHACPALPTETPAPRPGKQD